MASRTEPKGFQNDISISTDCCPDCDTPHLVIRNKAELIVLQENNVLQAGAEDDEHKVLAISSIRHLC